MVADAPAAIECASDAESGAISPVGPGKLGSGLPGPLSVPLERSPAPSPHHCSTRVPAEAIASEASASAAAALGDADQLVFKHCCGNVCVM
jgi:hypothetical protein